MSHRTPLSLVIAVVLLGCSNGSHANGGELSGGATSFGGKTQNDTQNALGGIGSASGGMPGVGGASPNDSNGGRVGPGGSNMGGTGINIGSGGESSTAGAGGEAGMGPRPKPYTHAGTCADPIPLTPLPIGRSLYGTLDGRGRNLPPDLAFPVPPPISPVLTCFSRLDSDTIQRIAHDITYSIVVPAGNRLKVGMGGAPTFVAVELIFILTADCTHPADTCLSAGDGTRGLGLPGATYENSSGADEKIFLTMAGGNLFKLNFMLQPIGVGCGAPWMMCDGTCIDTRLNANNCGTCGNSCGRQEACEAGQCRPSVWACQPGRVLCTDCTDLNFDSANCGQCGHACAVGQRCVDGACAADAVGESCANPLPRPPRSVGSNSGDVDLTSMSADVPVLPCPGSDSPSFVTQTGGFRDVVFTWTPLRSGQTRWAYGGGGGPQVNDLAMLQVFSSNTCNATSLVACSSQWALDGGSGLGFVDFTAEVGTTYYFVGSGVRPGGFSINYNYVIQP